MFLVFVFHKHCALVAFCALVASSANTHARLARIRAHCQEEIKSDHNLSPVTVTNALAIICECSVLAVYALEHSIVWARGAMKRLGTNTFTRCTSGRALCRNMPQSERGSEKSAYKKIARKHLLGGCPQDPNHLQVELSPADLRTDLELPSLQGPPYRTMQATQWHRT